MSKLTRVESPEQILETVRLARETWTQHYVPIIGQAQVDYMLDKFQSEAAVTKQIADGYEYYLLGRDGKSVGYTAIVPDAEQSTLMISKLYVKKCARGQGFGRKMLEFAEGVARQRRLKTLWLTVNKNNANSIACYVRMGFRNVASIVQDIGGGYVMDDYRMEKTIGQEEGDGER